MALFVATITLKNAERHQISNIKKGFITKCYKLSINRDSYLPEISKIEIERHAETIETVTSEILSVLKNITNNYSFTICKAL
jgi:hypothetical protein